jgi:predicted DNA binding CopG/RHH family protein
MISSMSIKPFVPSFTPLDEDERELEHLDASIALPEEAREAILAPYRAEAKKNVTMRLSEGLISELKKKAEEEGIPYQTLASIVLQKYVRGGYLEREAVREVVKALKD